ncbi:MAG TPA: AAA family ATPase [Streptosporangiaceae bacterium]
MRVVLRGRSAEMTAALRPLRRAVRTGRGGLLLITGEPGIGKSALLAAVAAEAGALGFGIGATAVVRRPAVTQAHGLKADGLEAHGLEAHGLEAHGLEALLLALRSGPEPLLPTAELTELTKLAEHTGDVAAAGVPVLLVDRMAGLLAERAASSPVLIVVDDLQWAGQACLAGVQALAARLAGRPVVWALGSRRTSRDFLRGLGEAGPYGVAVEWIRPAPLAMPDVTALARDRLGHAPDGALRRMLAGSGGNPRLMVEVIDGVAQAAARGEPTDRIPSALVRTVRRVMTRLGPGPRELVELMAVWSRALSVGEACALLPDLAEPEVARGIDRAIAVGLLGGSGHAVRLRFDLVREAVYGDVPTARRAELHLRCGQHLAGDGGPQADAGDLRAAAEHARAAARDGRVSEAATILRRAAGGLLPHDPAEAAMLIDAAWRFSRGRPDQTIGDAEVFLRAGRPTAALHATNLALARADHPSDWAALQALAARALTALDRPADALARVQAAGSGALRPERARLAAAEALALAVSGSEDAARAAAARALASAHEMDAADGEASGEARDGARDRAVEMVATQALVEVSRRHGRAGEALRHAQALRRLGNPDHPAYLADEVLALQQVDRLADAGLLLDAAGPAARACPELAGAQLGQDLALGQLALAEVSAAALAELGRELDRPADQELAQAARLVITLLREGPSAGRGLVKNGKENHDEAASGPSDAAGVGGWRSGLAVAGGWLALAQGRPAEGAAAARWALHAARAHGAPWLWQPGAMRLVAQLGLAAGDQKLAHEAAAAAELAAARNPEVPVFGGLACQVRGLAQGDASLLGRAWEILRSSPRPLLRAGAAQDYGRALLTGPGAGSRTAGVRLLDEAWDGFSQAGAWAARQAAERTLRQSGVRRAKWAAVPAAPAWPARGWDTLTDAERKVAELVSSGYTNRSTASQLGLSPNTVGTHVRSVFSKLHVQSRVQLANLWHEQLTAAAGAQPPARIFRAV